MNDKAQRAVQDADQTLARALALINDRLKQAGPKLGGISMARRQADELAQFLRAHCDELQRIRAKVEESGTDLNVQLLTTRHLELEEALRFVQRAFIQPRSSGDEMQALEAADWMCVEGFQLFVAKDPVSPVGPLVAIDSSQSPAVWAPEAELPIPSLFQMKTVARDPRNPRSLPPFPLVCLPGHLVRSPGYYPLLSHEVGHAVDNASGVSSQILLELPVCEHWDYWEKWMREIVADAIGITLSGEAFLWALDRYLAVLMPFDEVSASNLYPSNTLRLAFVGIMANYYQAVLTVDEVIPKDDDPRSPRIAKSLLAEFRDRVLPVIARHTLDKNEHWTEEHRTVADLAERVATEPAFTWPDQAFRLLPSVMALAQRRNPSLSAYVRFRELHQSVNDRPEWVEGPTNWIFSEDFLPSLRPTLLGADGMSKVPPLVLLAVHQQIAFVGATNWQLADKMAQAFEERERQPWDEILLFFASDELLAQVEYGDGDPRKTRDDSEVELAQRLQHEGWAKRWSIYRFNGPPIFASYWDWDARGGRIHISPALLGTVITQCPASDHLWHQDFPTEHYKKYVKHLEVLQSAKGTRVVISGQHPAPSPVRTT